MTAEYRERSQAEQIILEYVKAHGRITRREVVELCKVTSPQAKRLLAKLEKQGKLVRRGQKRGTYYEPAP